MNRLNSDVLWLRPTPFWKWLVAYAVVGTCLREHVLWSNVCMADLFWPKNPYKARVKRKENERVRSCSPLGTVQTGQHHCEVWSALYSENYTQPFLIPVTEDHQPEEWWVCRFPCWHGVCDWLSTEYSKFKLWPLSLPNCSRVPVTGNLFPLLESSGSIRSRSNSRSVSQSRRDCRGVLQLGGPKDSWWDKLLNAKSFCPPPACARG